MSDDDDQVPRERLKTALLDVAQQQLAQLGPLRASLLPSSWIDPVEVAAEADADPSIFETLWPGTDDSESELSPFESFVLDALDSTRTDNATQRVMDAIISADDDLAEVIRIGVEAAIWSMLAADNSALWIQVRCSIAASMYGMAERVGFDSYIEEISAMYEFLLHQLGRQMRPGLSTVDMAYSIAAIVDSGWYRAAQGVPEPNRRLRWSVDSSAPEQEWTVAAIAVWGIIDAITEPC